jgi:multiple antibiotic resistance protein
MDKLSASLLLLTTMDPLGNIANFLAVLRPVPPERRLAVIARELVIGLIILVVFLFCGRWLMGLLHLSQAALFISGGVVLFLIALKMVFPPSRREEEDTLLEEPFIVPLAMPLLAGPSVLATLLVLVSSEPQKTGDWLVAMLVAWGITSVILMSAPLISRVLKPRGTIAVERLMGMVLVMVSVQMFLNGLDHYRHR